MRPTLRPIRGVPRATHTAPSVPARCRRCRCRKPPAPLANNFQKYNNLLGSGVTFWAINPHALDNPMAYWKSLYPDTTTQASPGITWAVWHEGAVELSAGRFQRQISAACRTAVMWVRA